MDHPHRRCSSPRGCVAILAAVSLSLTAHADEWRPPGDPLDVRTYPLVLWEPAMDSVVVERDIPYLPESQLAFDLVVPASRPAGSRAPVVVFANGVGDAPGQPSLKDWTIYQDWARLMAARGLAGVTMNARHGQAREDLAALVEHLGRVADRYRLDATRIGIYACSANTSAALPYLMEDAPAEVKAAVICYGNAAVARFNTSLPLLFVIAGRDNPGLVQSARANWLAALDARAPWTLAFAPTLPHAFDGVDHTPESLAMVRQIADFFTSRLIADDPPFDESAEPLAEKAVRLGFGNDPRAAAAAWLELADERPDDVSLKARAGSALLQAGDARRAVPLLLQGVDAPDAGAGDWRDLGRALATTGREAEAVPWLQRVVDAGIEDSSVFGMLGHAALVAGDPAEGTRWYERAFAAGIPSGANTRGLAAWNLACGYALGGRTDEAFASLRLAVEEGFGTRAQLVGDADLASLRGDARWSELLATAPERR